jgi:hypothetical protein
MHSTGTSLGPPLLPPGTGSGSGSGRLSGGASYATERHAPQPTLTAGGLGISPTAHAAGLIGGIRSDTA